MTHPDGIEKMAKDFQSMMFGGGLRVGLVGTEENQMIAVAQTIRDMIEIRKFAVQMEPVLSVEYDKSVFPGNYITRDEAEKYNLKLPEDHYDDL